MGLNLFLYRDPSHAMTVYGTLGHQYQHSRNGLIHIKTVIIIPTCKGKNVDSIDSEEEIINLPKNKGVCVSDRE